MKHILDDEIYASYVCPMCDHVIENVNVQESIYSGAPICPECEQNEEMDISAFYTIEE